MGGTLSLTSVDINGGAIDGTPIGGTTPAAGTFTTAITTGGSITTSAIVVSTLITTGGSITASVVMASTFYGVGTWVQAVGASSTAFATGTTAIPYDDTIPQVGEGDEFFSVAITPKNANNILCIEALVNWSQTANSVCTFALFKDGGANSLYTVADFPFTTAQSPRPTYLRFYVAAGGVVAQTWSLRVGSNGVNTITVNGTGGARLYGGVLNSYMRITEFRTSY